MVQSVSILGATGSIGRQTLDVISHLPIRVAALTAGSDAVRLAEQCRTFRPELAVLATREGAQQLREMIADLPTRVAWGEEGLLEAATMPQADCVVTAVVGMIGLKPTLAAIRAGKRIGLANKETLVCAGELVMNEAMHWGAEIVPVDSEHSAIFQCLMGCADRGEIRKLILTCSGGPFWGKSREELRGVTKADALQHPNWKMGPKITVDCATLMNKGLEIIEAMRLYRLPLSKVEAVIHRQSIVHSLVELTDGAVMAQLGMPDMRLPIQYALTFPERTTADFGRLDFKVCHSLTFEQPDEKTFRNLGLAYEAMRQGGNMPCILNAANEVAVAAFLQGRLSFTGMSDLIEKTMQQVDFLKKPTLEDYMETDRLTREIARKNVSPKIPPL